MENKISIKNIKNLSILFIKDNFKNFYLIKNNKLNKKSMWFWLFAILIFGLIFISSEIINFLSDYGQEKLFIKGYFILLNIILFIQAIMLSINILYFSKDLEVVLPMPFKPIEILFAKFNTILYFLYCTLMLFAVVPFIMYGILIHCGILFYLKLIISLIIFPVFPILIIGVLILILMNLFKIIKNKNIIQNLMSLFLIIILFLGLYKIINNIFINNSETIDFDFKINYFNNYFIILNPINYFLLENNFLNNILNLFYLLIINISVFLVFAFIGNKMYLKQLLKISGYIKKKKIKIININNKSKKNILLFSYLKKEFRNIIKTPIFFIQCVYPCLIATFSISMIIILLVPVIKNYGMENNLFEGLSFDIEVVIFIVGLIQIIGLLNKTTITTISREGKNLFFMKICPVDFYKQFIYKSIPQLIVNSIASFIIIILLFYKIEVINYLYIIPVLIISEILLILNNNILLIVNLLNPKNNWSSEYDIFKNNGNILIQYSLIIFNIMFLYYFDKLFIDYDLNKSLIIFIIFLIFILIGLNFLINKFKYFIFKKIN